MSEQERLAFEQALFIGNTVEIVGLQGRPELNGRLGTPISFDAAKGRYKVRLHDDEMLAVKPANLRRLDPTPALSGRSGSSESFDVLRGADAAMHAGDQKAYDLLTEAISKSPTPDARSLKPCERPSLLGTV